MRHLKKFLTNFRVRIMQLDLSQLIQIKHTTIYQKKYCLINFMLILSFTKLSDILKRKTETICLATSTILKLKIQQTQFFYFQLQDQQEISYKFEPQFIQTQIL
ncbi:unnamed protein product [Paramecium pentaurelia]|uniref:Uncharacterized protein n=1 Tax=Paramecium pentaurelia TaxID=43138 RepID=A0A8S1Y5U4_9CILI|nr:unnamed protein product [Paramecium pentaurelia]